MNDIEIRVGSQDNTAADFDALKARLDDIAKKAVTASVNVNDKDAQYQLDLINAKIAETAKKVASPRIDVAGAARAQATLSGLDLQLDKLGEKSVEAEAKADTGDAGEKLGILDALLDRIGAKRVSARVSLDDEGFAGKLAADNAAMAGFGGHAQLLAAVVAAAVAALPALPGALAGVGSAAGVAALALSPVVKALEAASQQASASSKSMGQSSSQLAATELANSIAIVSAQRAIADAKTQAAHDAITSDQAIAQAEEGLKDAQTTAAHDQITSLQSIADAEQTLKQAEQTEQESQQSLTQARQQAVLTLQQLNDAQADSVLGAKQAALNLQEAEVNQQQVDASATSTALDKAQASLSVAEAEQALKEAQQQQTAATKAATTANKEGVGGLPAVIAAQSQVAQSAQAVAAAQKALARAHQQATWQQEQDAEAIKNAQTDVAKAQQQAAWSQQKDAEAVQTAVQALSDTYKEQQAQSAASAGSAAATATAFTQDMAGMTVDGRKVVDQMLAMKQGLHDLSATAQNAMLPGFSTFLTGANSLLPTVNREVGDMGRIVGGAFTDMGHALQSARVQQEIQSILDEGNDFTKVMLPALGNLGGALLDLGAKSGKFTDGLAHGLAGIITGVGNLIKDVAGNTAIADFGGDLGKWGDAFAKWSASKAARDDVDGFLKYLHDNGKLVVGIVKDLAQYVPGITGGASSAATLELGALSTVLGWVSKLPPSWAKPVTELAGAMLMLKKTGVLSIGLQLSGFGGGGGAAGGGGLAAALTKSTSLKWITRGGLLYASAVLVLKGTPDSGQTGIPGEKGNWFETPFSMPGPKSSASSGNWLTSWSPYINFVTKGIPAYWALTKANVEGTWDDLWKNTVSRAAGGVKDTENSLGILRTYASGAWDRIRKDAGTDWDDIENAIEAPVKAVTGWIAGKWDDLRGAASGTWAGVKKDASSDWNAIGNVIESAVKDVCNWLAGKWDDLRNVAASAWKNVRKDASSDWGTIENVIEAPVKALYNWLSGKWDDLRTLMSRSWTSVKKDASSGWGAIENAIKAPVSTTYSWVTGKWDDLRSAMSKAWTGIKGDATKGWGALKSIMGSPVNFVITDVYMGGIRRLWDDVVNALGLNSLDLPSVSPIKLAGGGKLGGYGGGDRNLALLEDGEAVVDKHKTAQYAPLLRAMGVPGMAAGGIVGDAEAVAKMTIAAATGNETAFANAFTGFFPKGKGGASGHLASVIEAMPVKLAEDMVKGAWKQITGAGAAGAGGGSGAGSPGGSGAVNAALARKMYPGWATGANWNMWNYIAMHESGWNAAARNPGSGALGIAQALGHGIAGGGGSLGNEYGGFGLSLAGDRAANSGNAGSQITWMHNYILSHWKSLAAAYNNERVNHWYGSGGATSPGLAVLGEHGRELVRLPGGASVTPHGGTEAALSGSSGTTAIQLEITGGGGDVLGQAIVTYLREYARVHAGGNVQRAIGRS